ncbi:MAG: hypothetical protein COB41_10480 [Proteobacteria bacterium]|nr:hypothetical protein [bacterium AH-315-G11]PCI41580.1 MAG: hypothetical protein COB41_10480 [Pseudomonadota bacterium]
MKLFKISLTLLLLMTASACSGPKTSVIKDFPKPIWLSGIQVNGIAYTKDFPKPLENKYLKTANAGYWLREKGVRA